MASVSQRLVPAFVVVALAGVVSAGGNAGAQSPPAGQAANLPSQAGQSAQSAPPAQGGHKHYTAPTDFQNQAAPSGQLAPRLQNLGTHTFPVSTKNAQAQLFINQGLNLSYAFNHAEAGRAFREAARLDPKLAMAYWGQALVLGPNINAAMEPADEAPAFAAIQKARRAEGQRVAARAGVHRRARDAVLGQGRRPRGARPGLRRRDEDACTKYPDDLDAAVLYVESVMDLRPWGYWMRRRHAVRGHRRRRRADRDSDREQAGSPGRAASLHPSRRSASSRRRPKLAADRAAAARCRRPGTWCTCRRTSISASAATPTR